MSLFKKIFAMVFLVGFMTSAHADFYIGAGAYVSNVDDDIENIDIDEDDVVPAVFVGYKPFSFLAFEGGYYDLGDYSDTINGTRVSAEMDAFTLGANAILPLTFMDLYGKIGAAYVDADLQAGNYEDDGSSTEIYYGVGGNINITQFVDIYIEYILFDTDVEVDMLGAGVRLEF